MQTQEYLTTYKVVSKSKVASLANPNSNVEFKVEITRALDIMEASAKADFYAEEGNKNNKKFNKNVVQLLFIY